MNFFNPPNYPYYDFNDVRINPISRINKVIERMRRAHETFVTTCIGSTRRELGNIQSVMPDWREDDPDIKRKRRLGIKIEDIFKEPPPPKKKRQIPIPKNKPQPGGTKYGSGNMPREYNPDPFSALERIAMFHLDE
jgi:hypothetical protein